MMVQRKMFRERFLGLRKDNMFKERWLLGKMLQIYYCLIMSSSLVEERYLDHNECIHDALFSKTDKVLCMFYLIISFREISFKKFL